MLIRTFCDELISEPDGGLEPKGCESPCADYDPQDMQEDSNWESQPGMDKRTTEIEKPNEEETDKYQASKKPGGKELPGTVRRGRPKPEVWTSNGTYEQEEINDLYDNRTPKQEMLHDGFKIDLAITSTRSINGAFPSRYASRSLA